MNFWIGLHQPNHLEQTSLPACVSYGRLRGRKSLPRPLGPVFLDSRGFSEIAMHGCYTYDPREYAAFVQRCADQWGEKLRHASIMDWMCEPVMLAKTRRSVAQHQQLTVNSWVTLNAINGALPWLPVLQGWSVGDYHDCADLYERHTCTRLADLPLVGLGSVCRRQGMTEAAAIVQSLYARGLTNLHGFGFKITGLVSKQLRLARYLASADSMAWSRRGRYVGKQNSLPFALAWRDRLIARVERLTAAGTQLLLF